MCYVSVRSHINAKTNKYYITHFTLFVYACISCTMPTIIDNIIQKCHLKLGFNINDLRSNISNVQRMIHKVKQLPQLAIRWDLIMKLKCFNAKKELGVYFMVVACLLQD